MSLRELLSVYYARLAHQCKDEGELDTLDRELNAVPGSRTIPRSRGTKALMALMGMPPPPPRPPAPEAGAA